MRSEKLTQQIDWWTILLYLILVLAGWFNIYAADYDPEQNLSIFNMSQNSGKQLLWIGSSLLLVLIIIAFDYRFFESFSYILYGVVIVLLVAVLLFGREVAGSTSWFEIGSFRLQPSEFSKIATSLALAKYLSSVSKKNISTKELAISGLIFLLPLALIVLQGDTGTALVFGSFVIVLFREGLSPALLISLAAIAITFILTLLVNQWVLIIGIVVIMLIVLGLSSKSIRNTLLIVGSAAVLTGFVLSVDFVLTDVLRPHQQKRVMSLVNPNADPLGIGWNVTQSKIAIGSGGFSGKGYLQGTQTKFDFVPAQSTDFIFCTVGEEHGWLGSIFLLITFGALLLRIIAISERQKSSFVRIYGYGVLSVLFFHFAINIAMTIGLFPVIGIPLPFFSYGGSSLWAFSIMLFILVKLDAHRMQLLSRT
jgi:rod shape determining protein RodA